MSGLAQRLWNDQEGAELTEYSLVIGVVALGAIAVLTVFRDAISGLFNRLVTSVNGVTP